MIWIESRPVKGRLQYVEEILKMKKIVTIGIFLFLWNMLFQYFINYNLPGGSNITTTPVITANWNVETS